MKIVHSTLVGVCAVSIASHARSEIVTATITCDNHYAIYTAGPDGIAYVGGNETGYGGDPGTYNWSMAETWSFNATGTVYVAAWSDNSVAQGLLAQFSSASLGTLLTGDARWRVYATHVDRNTGAPHPLASEIAAHVQAAAAPGVWEETYVGENNGVAPWGVIAGITTDARWIWHRTPGVADPLRPGSGAGEMLIFSFTVPTPAAAFAIALAPFARRTRRR
jgi:hypothetical protein